MNELLIMVSTYVCTFTNILQFTRKKIVQDDEDSDFDL